MCGVSRTTTGRTVITLASPEATGPAGLKHPASAEHRMMTNTTSAYRPCDEQWATDGASSSEPMDDEDGLDCDGVSGRPTTDDHASWGGCMASGDALGTGGAAYIVYHTL
ncbi:hypothetical protein FOMPIDRAFT_1056436 [Fomitopsis schrenkii]|uniref:Uncharacterized protein n=1 Tax=Fomitopsis schrenkii TaxID=2126942 RepID=S8ET82_FOMSC|nr:hypothetical protein FOMPIDRAFT_1056436 [Fomitopsis schrenkii]